MKRAKRFSKARYWLWRSDSFTRDTLFKIAKAVGGGAALAISATSPYFLHQVARQFFKDTFKKAIRARARRLRDLERRKLIKFDQLKGGEVRIELSHRGKKLVRQYNLDEMKLKKPEKWDRRWRVVIYDIPQYKRNASDAFRDKLEQLGLFRIQKSVWISPYECLAELEFLCSVFEIDIGECVHYFHTPEIPREGEARKFFDL